MRRTVILVSALLTMIGIPTAVFAQGGQMESSRGVAGGGITVSGWTGKIDAKEQANGMTINSAKLAKDAVGKSLQRDRMIFQVRQKIFRDADVVINNLCFRELLSRIEEFVEIRNGNRSSSHCYLVFCFCHLLKISVAKF